MKLCNMQSLRAIGCHRAIFGIAFIGYMLSGVTLTSGMQCSGIPPSFRFNCYPEKGATQQECQQRGCCWLASKNLDEGVPHCFYPSDFPTYQMGSPQPTAFGYTVMLKRTTKSYYPNDVMQLQMDLYFETSYRLHFKIYDPKSKRYEVPIPTPKVTKRVPSTDYKVQFSRSPMGLIVTRQVDGTVIFNSTLSPLIFADQFLQLSTSLVTPYIYGLGEHRGRFRIASDWETYPLWARDQPPRVGDNLYGVHPFHLGLEGSSGNSHGVFLLNSNAMEVVLQPAPALTYRTIGGILDFYIFMGPGSDQVVQQYTEVIGRPYMPPYWGLGFHLCRWGYGSSNRTLEIVKRMRAASIPQDNQWNDIDYLDGQKDFTINSGSYSGLPEMVKYLHSIGMHYIPIIDAGISSTQPAGTYPPYDTGIAQDVFVKNSSGKPIVGKVFPGATVFPDFFNETTKSWWLDQIRNFHLNLSFDGMWMDMNEPSSFVDGSVDGCPKDPYNNPPYTPATIDGGHLYSKTLCPSATQSIGKHYDLHSLYGYSESIATNEALMEVRKKRSFLIGRSTYPGSGKYTAHWLGDNNSLWPDMAYSIASILSFNLFGIPLVGADICGFNLNTTEELCQRWMQLGAFYPFSRNQNAIGNKDQDPAAFSKDMQTSTRNALQLRYGLLPYIYTLFHLAHTQGSTVARPLFFEFPGDPQLYDVDKQFMLGSAIVVTPVLEKGASSVTGIFPKGVWLDISSGDYFQVDSTKPVSLPAPLNKINVHMREGHIVPMQLPSGGNLTTTTQYRQLGFTLLVTPSIRSPGTGQLFWDDGDSLNTYESGNYLLVEFASNATAMNSTVVHDGYSGSQPVTVETIILGAVPRPVKQVTINGTAVHFAYEKPLLDVYIKDLTLPLQFNFYVKWEYQPWE
ncbi:lysosomal alpha-glucosidase-like [Acanthaster planci]|uniref:Lysosomal alpha-glucosidase-like n=1 Tax=Acanthaster planci TaxID=133434 RepID=A0A8B7ZF65_ACAPL|nr:lysosomal alpha-glucosidase-like [Acanthaster planci]